MSITKSKMDCRKSSHFWIFHRAHTKQIPLFSRIPLSLSLNHSSWVCCKSKKCSSRWHSVQGRCESFFDGRRSTFDGQGIISMHVARNSVEMTQFRVLDSTQDLKHSWSHSLLHSSFLSPVSKNGLACLGPSTFVSLAFCLGLIASALCDFVRLDEDNRDRKIFLIESAGLWCHTSTIDGGRYEYSTIQENQVLDDTFDATRSLSLTANILGFVLWLLFLFAGCLKFPPAVFALASCLAMCATLFEGTKIPYTKKRAILLMSLTPFFFAHWLSRLEIHDLQSGCLRRWLRAWYWSPMLHLRYRVLLCVLVHDWGLHEGAYGCWEGVGTWTRTRTSRGSTWG